MTIKQKGFGLPMLVNITLRPYKRIAIIALCLIFIFVANFFASIWALSKVLHEQEWIGGRWVEPTGPEPSPIYVFLAVIGMYVYQLTFLPFIIFPELSGPGTLQLVMTILVWIITMLTYSIILNSVINILLLHKMRNKTSFGKTPSTSDGE